MRITSCLAVGLISGSVSAQILEPLITDRPDFTESPATVHAGHVQFEGGYTFAARGGDNTHSFGELLVRIGAASDLEFRVGLNSRVVTRTGKETLSGFQDAALGLKFNVITTPSGRGGFAFSILVASSIPTGSLLYTNDRPVPELKTAFAFSVSERTTLSWNVNYAYAVENEERFNQIAGSGSVGYILSPCVGLYVEYYGVWPNNLEGRSLHFVNGGTTFLITGDVQADIRAGKGFNSLEPDYFIGLGGAVRL